MSKRPLSGRSSALLTDRYELTMLDAALRSGMGEQTVTFEVFSRRLPPNRTHGVFAGLGRLLDALMDFVFGPEELDWLARERVVSSDTISWLEGRRFSGSIDAYAEGEIYTVGSPVLIVEGGFGEAVLLETLVLSVLNHDSAVASAAGILAVAASGRPVIEMGSRRSDPQAAVASARAAYIAGFSSTSNLEAGRRYGIPTAGTAAHSFILAYPSEAEAFAAQVEAMGAGTTLLVDTYDIESGITTAVEVAGTSLGAVRIDSGDLAWEARRARRLLDSLGARSTRIVLTGDLDDRSLAALSDAPVDGFGVGANVVNGLGHPTANFVYKMVAAGRPATAGASDGYRGTGQDTGPGGTGPGGTGPGGIHRGTEPVSEQRPVAKLSAGKATVGGRKWAWRDHLAEMPDDAEGPTPPAGGGVAVDLVYDFEPEQAPSSGARALQTRVLDHGVPAAPVPIDQARRAYVTARSDLGPGEALVLVRRSRAARATRASGEF